MTLQYAGTPLHYPSMLDSLNDVHTHMLPSPITQLEWPSNEHTMGQRRMYQHLRFQNMEKKGTFIQHSAT